MLEIDPLRQHKLPYLILLHLDATRIKYVKVYLTASVVSTNSTPNALLHFQNEMDNAIRISVSMAMQWPFVCS